MRPAAALASWLFAAHEREVGDGRPVVARGHVAAAEPLDRVASRDERTGTRCIAGSRRTTVLPPPQSIPAKAFLSVIPRASRSTSSAPSTPDGYARQRMRPTAG